MATYPHTFRKLTYDPVASFTPVHGIGAAPLVLVVNAASPYRTLADLVAAARAAPDRLNYGTVGISSAQHLTTVLLMNDAGIGMTHIPYKTTSAVLIDLLGGSIDLMFDVANVLKPQIEAGRLRALAVSSTARLRRLPDVPTFTEAGFPAVVFTAWAVVMAPAGTPPAVVSRLSAAFDRALQDPRVVAYHENLGMTELTKMGPAATRDFIAAESARMKILVDKAGITAE
jgi:tripartite-type tricarboxylate transporter receptor subunit TctC